ncbi:MAG: fumarylacetoacetase [Lewinellaceae bacterium]|nr:fumarylacetoacetase [Saprospiraceae bacterium]MCB9333536.1 fumarylacetoacetase [Lewinellaceae bacterium]
MKTWLTIAPDSDFSIHNLPFGIFDPGDGHPRAGIAIGDHIVDLAAAAESGLLGKKRYFKKLFEQPVLNDFIAEGKTVTNRVRRKIQTWLCLPQAPENAARILVERQKVQMLLPIRVGDYTDFYSSIEHATNVGKMFRPDNPLLPNWRWIPVGYHGRSSSIVVSGSPVRRPYGQLLPKDQDTPVFAPSQRLDFELEMAFVIGKNTAMGEPIPAERAEEYIFGLLLFNDWSARDIQRWEYVPLGPFLGKNFGSSVSPWIVPLEALKPFRVKGPKQNPAPLDYLQTTGSRNYDIDLEVSIRPGNGSETVVCRSNMRYLYWSMAQQLAHHTSNGCNVQVGDLMASGTISGPEAGSFGSMLELSWGGQKPVSLNDGSTRTFLQDGDAVIMRGWAQKNGFRVGFGEVVSQLLPAAKYPVKS